MMLAKLAADMEARDNRCIAAISGKPAYEVVQSALTVIMDADGHVILRRRTDTATPG